MTLFSSFVSFLLFWYWKSTFHLGLKKRMNQSCITCSSCVISVLAQKKKTSASPTSFPLFSLLVIWKNKSQLQVKFWIQVIQVCTWSKFELHSSNQSFCIYDFWDVSLLNKSSPTGRTLKLKPTHKISSNLNPNLIKAKNIHTSTCDFSA